MQKSLVRKGAKPLPRDVKRTDQLRESLKMLNLSAETLCGISKVTFSPNNLRLKLSNRIGWNPGEIEDLERIVRNKKKLILKKVSE